MGIVINKKRMLWIDIAKAIAIYFVVLGHVGTFGCIELWIHAFHMPLFFCYPVIVLIIKNTPLKDLS